VIVDYDPAWAHAFERERGRIARALGADALSIEHIGSTAVPGLGFRDQLRRSADDRARYEGLKRELAGRDWNHTQEYADAKGALIEAITAGADS
jgi:GrpB-like predicted nucleotidyltransferase (UPF0157 family)